MITGTLPVFNLTKEQNGKIVSCYLKKKKKNQLFELHLTLNSLKNVYFHKAFYSLVVLYIRNKEVITSYLITSWEQGNADHPFCSSEFQGMTFLDLSL